MRGSAMKNFSGIRRTSRVAIVTPATLATFALLAAFAGLLLPGAEFAQGQGQDKTKARHAAARLENPWRKLQTNS